ncbi:MAG: hypothetical protein KAT34_13070 [Candidatus Aminicenantes bacterium]|nr:hypothetical protein [Candidatus Aminicenantes bacterium]
MSSILKALKKLDEETLYREDHTGEQKIKMRQMINRRSGTPRVINRLLFISLALLLLSTITLIIMNSNRKPSISSEQPAVASHKPLLGSPPKRAIKKESPKEETPPAVISEQSQPAAIPAFSGIGRRPRSTREAERVQSTTVKRITKKTADQRELEKNNDTGFILNGIIWLDKPGMRVALINDRYLKEGDSINGVTVIEIKKNAVTLQRGKEKWTIRIEK